MCKDQDFTNFMFLIVYLLFCIVHARICRITAWDAMRNQASVITRRHIKCDARRDCGESILRCDTCRMFLPLFLLSRIVNWFLWLRS